MILGLGFDLVDVEAFSVQLADEASVFVASVFSDDERSYAESAVSRMPAQHLAARYAAKEAALKAFDFACARAGTEPPQLALRDIEVARDARGRPSLVLRESAARLAETLGIARALLSLTHDGRYAGAVVAFESL